MLLSLIIPVHNAEKFLPASLESILVQDTGDTEIVFVDDGSTDGSAAIISDFLRDNQITGRLVRQENGGVSVARNTGLAAARGDYLVFLDADDRLSEGALRTIAGALDGHVDILGWDWLNVEGDNVRAMRQADFSTPEEALQNLMGGTMKWNLWLFTVRRELVQNNGISFVPGADMGEDMMFMLKSFACAVNVKQIHQPLYRYNASNPASISNGMTQRRRGEVSRNLDSAASFLASSPHAALAESYLPHLKLYIKRPLLISTSEKDYQTWLDWWPESNAYAVKNRALPLRTRLLQGLAQRRMFCLLKVYNKLVYGFLYRILYR